MMQETMHREPVVMVTEGIQDIRHIAFVREVCSLHELNAARALREIRYYQKTALMLIHKLPFLRIVRDIAQKCAPFGPQLRFTGEALAALQCVTEETMTMIFEMTYTQTCISLTLGTKR